MPDWPRYRDTGHDTDSGAERPQTAGMPHWVKIDHQVNAQRPDPGPVLRRRRSSVRERAGRDMPAATAPLLGDMLDDPQQRALGQIEHLPALAARDDLAISQVGATAIAALGRMLDMLVGDSNRFKPHALTPLLAAPTATRRTPQAALLGVRAGLGQPVRRRRPRRVARVLAQTPLKLGDLRSQLADQRILRSSARLKLLIARPTRNIACTRHGCKLPCKTAESCLGAHAPRTTT